MDSPIKSGNDIKGMSSRKTRSVYPESLALSSKAGKHFFKRKGREVTQSFYSNHKVKRSETKFFVNTLFKLCDLCGFKNSTLRDFASFAFKQNHVIPENSKRNLSGIFAAIRPEDPG